MDLVLLSFLQMKQESRLVTSTCDVCPAAGVTRLLYRPCFLGMPGCGLMRKFVCVCVCRGWGSVFVLLKQLTETDILNLDMNIIQMDGILMPYMLIYYNQFDIVM